MKVAITLLLLNCLSPLVAQTLPYQDSGLPVQRRVEDLLERLTLEEKVAQMCQYVGLEHIRQAEARMSARQMRTSDAAGFYPGLKIADLEKMTAEGMIGSFLHVVTLEEANHLQKLALQSRWKIPLLIGIDAVHGNALVSGATVFPTAIGLASTFDPKLAEHIGRATAKEMRATGSQWTFAPVVDVSRDPRWGRVGETFGEDHYLAGQMGAAMVRGFQGDLTGPDSVIACAKHLAAGGDPPNGLNAAPMDVSERTLRQVYLPPYKDAVDAGVFTMMTAHNEINGVPCHANKWLVEDVVRDEFGFRGFIVSDWMDIERLATIHRVAADQKEAVYQTVVSGMDMHMHGPGFQEPLVALVGEGRIPESRIDASVRRILAAKFQLGLFENPIVDPSRAAGVVFSSSHQALALEAARKSIVLLTNDGVLPIDTAEVKRIFVTGPNADNHTTLGDWTLAQPEGNVITVVEGLKQVAPGGVTITHFDSGSSIKRMDDATIQVAGEKARGFDLAIVVIGENPLRYENREKTSGENVDRSQISLAGKQLELAQAVHASGAPTVVVLVNGRPLGIEWIAENIPGILEAWEPGAKGGRAIAEILFGKVNPSGRLAMSFPRTAGHIQTIYNHKPSQYFRQYTIGETDPLFGFGDGLSYTTFKYSNLRVPPRISRGQPVRISLDVANTGRRAGDEVILAYVNDVISSVTTPVKELKAFERVSLKPGESKTVELTIAFDQLALYNRQMKRVVEPGEFELAVGDQKAVFTVTR